MNEYNPKFLEFIYLLNKADKLMSFSQMAKYMQGIGFNISERTIVRWFDDYKDMIGYFPIPNFKAMGLQMVTIFVEGLKTYDFFKIVPYVYSVHQCYSFDRPSRDSVILCAVPPEFFDNFESFWSKAVESKIIVGYNLIKTKGLWMVPIPLHDRIDRCGGFIPGELEHFEIPAIKNSYTMHHPLYVPIVMNYPFAQNSSRKLWYFIKEKLGDSVWPYLGKIKSKSDSAGTNKILDITKELKEEKGAFSQVIATFGPIYSNRWVFSCNLFTLKDPTQLESFVNELAKRSIFVYILYPEDENKIIVMLSTNHENHLKVVRDILPKYLDLTKTNKTTFLDNEFFRYRQAYLKFIRFDYSNFDPVSMKWKKGKIHQFGEEYSGAETAAPPTTASGADSSISPS